MAWSCRRRIARKDSQYAGRLRRNLPGRWGRVENHFCAFQQQSKVDLTLESKDPHANVAKGATLGWGSLGCWIG